MLSGLYLQANIRRVKLLISKSTNEISRHARNILAGTSNQIEIAFGMHASSICTHEYVFQAHTCRSKGGTQCPPNINF